MRTHEYGNTARKRLLGDVSIGLEIRRHDKRSEFPVEGRQKLVFDWRGELEKGSDATIMWRRFLHIDYRMDIVSCIGSSVMPRKRNEKFWIFYSSPSAYEPDNSARHSFRSFEKRIGDGIGSLHRVWDRETERGACLGL